MSQSPPAPFLNDPITVSRKELVEHYRAQATRYKQLAERQHRSSIYEGLLDLARQCAAMADALAAPTVANQSTKPELSESEILILHNRVIEEKSVAELEMGRAQWPSLMATAQELSLDEILHKIQRDIATGNPAPG